MSIGLPAHLAPQAIRRSLVNAQHTVAFTLLSVAVLVTLVFQGARLTDVLWPASLALLPSMALLLLRNSMKTVLWCLTYLVVSGIGLHLYAIVMLGQFVSVAERDGFSFLSAKVAIMMVGGATLGVVAGIAWTVAGFVVAELAIQLARVDVGMPVRLDIPTLFVLVITLTVISMISHYGWRQRRAQPKLHQAAQDEQVAEIRYGIEVKAAALMHDTVLNHLVAIADSEASQLASELREQVGRDVSSLVGEEWLAEPTDTVGRRARDEWVHSGLFAAIQESRLLGLDVDASGDLAAVSRLGRGTSETLGLAVKQCLVNVVKHSGTLRAEVAVYGAANTVTVMVVDGGQGFDESQTGSDRLGLKSSVRRRIELIGGEVTIWSTPGRGTSVMITVPADADGPSEGVQGVATQ